MIAPRDRSGPGPSPRISARHAAAHGGRTDVLTLLEDDVRTVDDVPTEAIDGDGDRVVIERVDVDGLRLERLSVSTDDGLREPSLLRTGPISLQGETAAESTAPWLPRFVAVLVVLDVLALLIGGLVGALLSSRGLGTDVTVRTAPAHSGISYLGVLLFAVPVWILGMAGSRAYEGRCLGLGSEEFR